MARSSIQNKLARDFICMALAFVLLSIGSMCSFLYPYQNRVDQNFFSR